VPEPNRLLLVSGSTRLGSTNTAALQTAMEVAPDGVVATYPVLHYLHSPTERTAPAVSYVLLDEAITLLRWGVAPEARPDPAAVVPLGEAVGLFLETIRSTFVADFGGPLPPPDLQELRKAGIPVVDDDEFAAVLYRQKDRRCLLTGLLRDDGWSQESWQRWRARVET
jgi:hypothetical protein